MNQVLLLRLRIARGLRSAIAADTLWPVLKPYLAEAIGTMILVLLGDGVVANVLLGRSKGANSGWIVVTTGWGVAVAVAVYAVGRISGAHLNPAVTMALATIGSFSWAQAPGYVLAQMAGAFAGAVLVWLAYLPHWSVTTDRAAKLGVFVAEANPNTIDHLTADMLGHHRFAFPPAAEQGAISDHLHDQTRTLDSLAAKNRNSIALLREYRTRLIADVVTGKLDVCSMGLPALDEAEAVEDWDPSEDAQADEMDEMEGVAV